MTAREKRLTELDEQRRCLEELTEDDVGCDVWVRDKLGRKWIGPFAFEGFSEYKSYPFRVRGAVDRRYSYATKTPPIEPQKITLRRWHGTDIPVSSRVFVGVQLNNLRIPYFDHAGNFSPGQWEHSDQVSEERWITHYAPIEIEVEK